jgi:hypothetical protein
VSQRLNTSPASCSFNIAKICPSLNLLRFIHPPLVAADPSKIWSGFMGSGHSSIRSLPRQVN